MEIFPVPEFVDYLTLAARAIYDQENGTSTVVVKCRCGALDKGHRLPDPNFSHGRRRCQPLAPAPQTGTADELTAWNEHMEGQVVANVVTMNLTYTVTLMAELVDPKGRSRLRLQIIQRLAAAYNTAVDKGLIVHGNLWGAHEFELNTIDMTKRWTVALLPYVQTPEGEWKVRERLEALNQVVCPLPPGLPPHYSRMPHDRIFKNEGEV